MRIYLAHTYGRRANLSEAECEANVHKAINLARQLIAKGHIPYVPLLLHYVHTGWVDSPSEPEWFKIVSVWIRFCDAFFCGHKREDSIRVAEEVQIALSLNMPVYYNINEVPWG